MTKCFLSNTFNIDFKNYFDYVQIIHMYIVHRYINMIYIYKSNNSINSFVKIV